MRRLALDTDGNLTYCEAKPENVGKGRCNHVEHQNNAESLNDFLKRVEPIKDVLNKEKEKRKQLQQEIAHGALSEETANQILDDFNKYVKGSGSYLQKEETNYKIIVPESVLIKLKANVFIEKDFNYEKYGSDYSDILNFEGNSEYGFYKGWTSDRVRETLKYKKMYPLFSIDTDSILGYSDDNNLENLDKIKGIALNRILQYEYGDIPDSKLGIDDVVYTQLNE